MKAKQFLIQSWLHAASVPFLLSPDLTTALATFIADAKGKQKSQKNPTSMERCQLSTWLPSKAVIFLQALFCMRFPHPHVFVCAKLLQACLTLRDPMDCSPPGSSVHRILQARVLEWVAISSSRKSSQPRDRTHVSCISCIDRKVLYHQRHLESLLPSPTGELFIPNRN